MGGLILTDDRYPNHVICHGTGGLRRATCAAGAEKEPRVTNRLLAIAYASVLSGWGVVFLDGKRHEAARGARTLLFQKLSQK